MSGRGDGIRWSKEREVRLCLFFFYGLREGSNVELGGRSIIWNRIENFDIILVWSDLIIKLDWIFYYLRSYGAYGTML